MFQTISDEIGNLDKTWSFYERLRVVDDDFLTCSNWFYFLYWYVMRGYAIAIVDWGVENSVN